MYLNSFACKLASQSPTASVFFFYSSAVLAAMKSWSGDSLLNLLLAGPAGCCPALPRQVRCVPGCSSADGDRIDGAIARPDMTRQSFVFQPIID